MSASRFRPPSWRLLAIACLCVAVLFGVVTPAPAGSLTPGSSIANDGLAAAGLTVVADTGYVAYTLKDAGGTIRGTGLIREIVATNDGTDVQSFGAGTLTFLYQAVVKSGDISGITVSIYDSFKTNASAVTGTAQNAASAVVPPPAWNATDAGGGLLGATPIHRSGGGLVGDNVTFDFSSAAQPGGNKAPPDVSTVVMIVRTDALFFGGGNIAIIDTGTANIAGFAPSTGAPEPASMTLLGIGLAGMAGYGWRRRRQATSKQDEPALAV